MGTKKFDEAIRKKVNGMEHPRVPAHWEAMAALLDQKLTEAPLAGFGEETRMDQGIARKLDKIRPVGSAAQHWPELEQRLRAQDILFERVVLVKSTEVSLFLLLVVSFLQWLPVEAPSLPEYLTPALRPQATTPPNRVQPIASLKSMPSRVQLTSSKKPVRSPMHPIASLYMEAPHTLPSNKNLPSLHVLPSAEQPVLHTVLATPSITSSTPELPSEGAFSMPLIATPYFSEVIESLEKEDSSEIEFFPVKRKPIFNIAMLGGSDFNRVMTPPNYAFRTKGFDRYTKGYSGGILLGMEYGRMEAGAGLVYAAKEYQPLPVIFVKGSNQKGFVAESLEGIQLNLVNLPVYLRYDVVRQNKWRAYVSGGGSLQIALYANYFISPPISLPASGQAVVVEGDIQNTTGGWFEGGSFKQNSYVTANIALGLERFVSERWSVFTQPTYQQSIGYFSNGLGPNLDRIHTLSLWTGIRVRLIE